MRTLSTLTTAALALLLASACDVAPAPTSPTSQNDLEPQASHAPGLSGCHPVQGHFHEQGPPFALEGELTGDLVGTSEGALTNFVKQGNPLHAAGHNFGVRTYSITGGSIPALVGGEFTVQFVGINVGDEADLLFDVEERAKATSGVRKANLTSHGTLDATGLAAPPFTVVLDMEYRGVVCP